MVGVSINQAIKLFSLSKNRNISCCYLLVLGKLDLFKNFIKINNTNIINNSLLKSNNELLLCKYGKTIDLNRRLKEHRKDYSNILKNIENQSGISQEIKLLNYKIMKPDKLTINESYIRNSMKFSDRQLDFIDINNKKRNELIIINNSKKDLNNLNNLFNILV